MLVTIDVGNTRTCIGCFVDGVYKYYWNMHTVKTDTDDELIVKFIDLLKSDDISIEDVSAICLSCVVPQLTQSWAGLCYKNNIKIVECNAVNARKLPNSVYFPDVDNPDEIGSDYIAASIAAKIFTDKPCVVFDFGTATNAAVIDKNGNFVGGIIVPGLETSLNSLITKASALHDVRLEVPDKVIGKNTEVCIQSGIVYGEAERTDGLINRMERELGYPLQVFLTGGLSGLISPNLNHPHEFRPFLLQHGLKLFYDEFIKVSEK